MKFHVLTEDSSSSEGLSIAIVMQFPNMKKRMM